MSQIRSYPEHVTFIFRHKVSIKVGPPTILWLGDICPTATSVCQRHLSDRRIRDFGFCDILPITFVNSDHIRMSDRNFGQLSLSQFRSAPYPWPQCIILDSTFPPPPPPPFQSFSENHFFPRFMSPWSLWAENIFSIFKSGPRTRGFPYYVRQCPL